MKGTWKKMRAIALMLCCALLVNAISFTSFATEQTETSIVNVAIMGNDGQITMTQTGMEQEGPYNGWVQECEVGTTLGDYLTIDSVTFWDSERAFEGWMLCTEEEFMDDWGDIYTQNVQIPGTDIFTTEEALAYEVTADYDTIIFLAQWAGDDDDYYSEIAFDAYGGRYIYNNIYWENDKQVEEEIEVESWSKRLRTSEDSIATQTADYFEFISDPTKADAEFEGWLEFRRDYVPDDFGNIIRKHELISETLYTTEQALAKAVPEYNVCYTAKWSDTDLEDYYLWEGPWGRMELDGKDGIITVTEGENNVETTYHCIDLPVGQSMNDAGISIVDPMYWTEGRDFEGWMLCTWEEIVEEDGHTYWGYVQVPDTEIYTTEEVLAYEFTEGVTYFVAQWTGNDDDYYSQVDIDAYHSTFTYNDIHWENDEAFIEECETEYKGNWLKTCDEGIATQAEDYFRFVDEPVREGAEFEGWLAFRKVYRTDEEGKKVIFNELISDTVYTTEQMLSRPIPTYDVVYAAKWSDIEAEDYYQWGNIELELNGGTITVCRGNDSFNTDHQRMDAPRGFSVSDNGWSIEDPVYWNLDRAFEGWMLATKEEVREADGNVHTEFVQVPDTELMTTADVLSYKIMGDVTYFVAQWAGDDDDYYSHIELDAYGGTYTVINSYWENDEKVSEEIEVNGWNWNFTLKNCDEGIGTQTSDWFALKADPVKEGAEFEGWAEFEVIYTTYDDGTTIVEHELVSDTIYTTEQMLQKAVPEYDVKYVAKWSDMELEDYFVLANYPSGTLIVDANDGIMTLGSIDAIGCYDSSYEKWVFSVGESLLDQSLGLSDPVFWNPDREFEGWKQCMIREILSQDGGTYIGYVQVPGTELFTSQQVEEYKVTEEPTIFVAQWAGSDDLYYVQVDIDAYGACFTVTNIHWENDEKIERDVEVERFGNRFRICEDGIGIQAEDYCVFKEDPVREDVEFEGWVEFKQVYLTDEAGRSFTVYELVSDTIYTTEEMLSRAVPNYNVCYVAKWSDIDLEDYFKEDVEENISDVWGNYVLFGGTGDITFSYLMENGSTNTQRMGTYQHMLGENQTLNDYLTYFHHTYGGVEKACSELVGWQVFTYDTAQWYELPEGDILEVEDTTAVIEPAGRIFYTDYTNDRFIVMTGCEKYKGLLTTEEAFALGGDGKNYYVTAVWNTKHTEGTEQRRDICMENGQGSYMSLIHCTKCGKLLKSWERTFTVESQQVTLPDSESAARVEITSRVMDVPAGINEMFADVSDIEEAMVSGTVAAKEHITAKNIKKEFMDVELKVQNESGDWETVTHENFPEEGITILLPYPEGTDMDTEGFAVSHMISDGEEAGTIEILPYTKEERGLRVTVTSLSPIMIAYAQENPFGDLKEADWYYSFSMFAYNNSLMNGKGKMEDGITDKFDPANTITRAEFVRILYNKEGAPEVEYSDIFADVPEETWYTNAILWAYDKGIVKGKGEDYFDVSGNITRLEIAQILYKYALYKGYDVDRINETDLSDFVDDETVANWGQKAMKWAVGYNIISGKEAEGGNELAPNGYAIRAEAATMMKKFMVELEGVEE